MKYSTHFSGFLGISPPLSNSLIERINCFSDELSIWPDFPSSSCDVTINGAGDRMIWSGSEASYVLDQQMAWLYEHIITPKKYQIEGVILAFGQNVDDRWCIVADGKRIIRTPMDCRPMLGLD